MSQEELITFPANFAGSFYPKDSHQLKEMMKSYEAKFKPKTPNQPKAYIMPHAGYRFSGLTASAAAVEMQGNIRRVVVIGPSHRHAFNGIATLEVDQIETPLGPVGIDKRARAGALRLDFVNIVPEAFENEHSVEVELPWIKEHFPNASVSPYIVGNASTEEVATLIEALWGDFRTAIIISTDLSHFKTAEAAMRSDLATAVNIEKFNINDITREGACGWRPLRGFLLAAKRKNMRISRLHMSHSGLVNNDNSRVVGYGAWAAHLPENAEINQIAREKLYNVAANAIYQKIETGTAQPLKLTNFGNLLNTTLASFVTLEIDDKLRGCIGSLVAHRALVGDVYENALKSAFQDPRFGPLSKSEFEKVECEIAILSSTSPIEYKDRDDLVSKLVPGEDGLILRYQNNSGTFLPKVWDGIETPDMFLKALVRKARLEDGFWSDDIMIHRYRTERFDQVKLVDYVT